jgi:hypothetical protein
MTKIFKLYTDISNYDFENIAMPEGSSFYFGEKSFTFNIVSLLSTGRECFQISRLTRRQRLNTRILKGFLEHSWSYVYYLEGQLILSLSLWSAENIY